MFKARYPITAAAFLCLLLVSSASLGGCDSLVCGGLLQSGSGGIVVRPTLPIASFSIAVGDSVTIDMDSHWADSTTSKCDEGYQRERSPSIGWATASGPQVEVRADRTQLHLRALASGPPIRVRVAGIGLAYSTACNVASLSSPVEFVVQPGGTTSRASDPRSAESRQFRVRRIAHYPNRFSAGDTVTLIAETTSPRTFGRDLAWFPVAGVRENPFSGGGECSLGGLYLSSDTLRIVATADTLLGMVWPGDSPSSGGLGFYIVSHPPE